MSPGPRSWRGSSRTSRLDRVRTVSLASRPFPTLDRRINLRSAPVGELRLVEGSMVRDAFLGEGRVARRFPESRNGGGSCLAIVDPSLNSVRAHVGRANDASAKIGGGCFVRIFDVRVVFGWKYLSRLIRRR